MESNQECDNTLHWISIAEILNGQWPPKTGLKWLTPIYAWSQMALLVFWDQWCHLVSKVHPGLHIKSRVKLYWKEKIWIKFDHRSFETDGQLKLLQREMFVTLANLNWFSMLRLKHQGFRQDALSGIFFIHHLFWHLLSLQSVGKLFALEIDSWLGTWTDGKVPMGENWVQKGPHGEYYVKRGIFTLIAVSAAQINFWAITIFRDISVTFGHVENTVESVIYDHLLIPVIWSLMQEWF